MPVKYIRPNNLITDRKTTKLIKQKKFISEDEYEMNISIIQELLDELNKKENEIENTLNVDYDTFESFRDNIRKNISEISRYIDNSLHNNNYNAEKTVIDLNKIIDNKYKDIKNLYDKLNIEESIINNNFLKYIYIEYIEYNKKKKDYFEINKKIDFTDELTLKINNNEKIEVKNINKNDIYIIYDEYANIESKMTNMCLKLYLENFCNAKSINEYKILSDIKFNYDINMTNDNSKEPIFLKLNLNNPCVSIKKRCTSISFCYNSVSSGSYGYLYIDGEFKNRYYGSWLEESITDLTDEEHEITFVSINDFILYCIKINNELIFPNDFNNTGTLQLGREGGGNSHYYNSTNKTVPFYAMNEEIRCATIKKKCTVVSFYYKTSGGYVYLYIDGIYKGSYNSSSWTQASITDLTNEEHEFTWLLYATTTNGYSCIDTIIFNDEIITDINEFNNEYKIILENISPITMIETNDKTSTPFYINGNTKIKYVSIKKKCASMSFYYNTYNGYVYLYIDGVYKNRYTSISWRKESITDLTDEEHEFTWVLVNNNDIDNTYSYIDTISFNNELITDVNEFNNNHMPILINNFIFYKNGNKTTTPFYSIGNFEYVSIKKKRTLVSFYYKTSGGYVYLYIDGIYKGSYNSSSWTQASITDLTDEEHEFVWILVVDTTNGYSCIDTISFNDESKPNINEFNNEYKTPLIADIPIEDKYKNSNNTSTPFYNNKLGIKCVSIKKRCTTMSFYYKTNNGYIYLYIDGEYRIKYSSSSWRQASITDLTDEEHEFVWVLLINSNNADVYSCIDTISFDDELVTDINEFNNEYKMSLADIPTKDEYKNGDKTTTPFYSISGVKCVSIKKKRTLVSFYYKTSGGYVYLYIDGVYKGIYSSSSWKQASVTDLTNEEHEFTWILVVDENTLYTHMACIDTIAFNGELITNINEFNNENEIPLADIPTEDNYKHGEDTTTPFYTADGKIKCVSIKKKCMIMSFYYKTNNGYTNNGYIYLYIDGVYRNKYSSSSWTQASITDLTDEEHQFTLILPRNSCIDTIAFNSELLTDTNEFNTEYKIPLADIATGDNYKNGNKTTTPFYNNNFGIKCVSIKKKCTVMSFYYKTYSNYSGYVCLYIDGEYRIKYSSSSWRQASITDLTDEEHEFTWVLLVNSYDGYSCIDTIAFNSESKTNINEFNTKYKIPLADIPTGDNYKNGNKTTTPFYNNGNTNNIKFVSVKKKCTSMSFYYKNYNTDGYVYLYIDGVYKNQYDYSYTSWIHVSITDLTDEEHEFTWMLTGYSCIDTISFNDELITDTTVFNNEYNVSLIANIPTEDAYKYGDKTTTPFYNIEDGIKFVSIKKKCTGMNFYFKVNKGNVYLYEDGILTSRYDGSDSWKRWYTGGLTDEEHEFTWKLVVNSATGYSCIDTINFIDEFITDTNEFNNEYKMSLADIPTKDEYKNGDKTTTPFYSISGVKCVSIKKKRTLVSFYYKTSGGYVYLYIDGVYKGIYSSSSWKQASVTDLTNEEHEFTWILFGSTGSCIDTIIFNDELITDINEFNNEYNNQIANILTENNHINNDNIFTPFYSVGDIKYISIKKKCTSMSFYYMTFNNGYVYLYIDGIYRNKYSSSGSLTQVSITDLTDEEHEFTWVLYATTINGLSYINTINFNNDINVFENAIMSNDDFLNIISHAIEDKKMEIENTIYYNTLYYIKGINKIFKNLIDLSNEKNKYVIKHDNDIFIYNDFYSFINKIYYFDYCFIYVYNEERTKKNRVFTIDLNNNDENLEKINVNIENSKDKFLRIVNNSNEIEIYKNIKYMK